ESEVIFQRQIDLIDIAGGNVIVHPGKGAVVLIARPGKREIGDRGLWLRAMGGEPGACLLIIERPAGAKQPKPQQRNIALARDKVIEPWLEAVAKLVGEKAGRMKTARAPGFNLVERARNLVRGIGRDDMLGIGVEQAAAARGQAVVEQDKGRRGHIASR